MARVGNLLLVSTVLVAVSGCLAATVVVVNGTASHAIPTTLCESPRAPILVRILIALG